MALSEDMTKIAVMNSKIRQDEIREVMKSVCKLYTAGKLSLDQALWYEAYEVYSKICSMSENFRDGSHFIMRKILKQSASFSYDDSEKKESFTWNDVHYTGLDDSALKRPMTNVLQRLHTEKIGKREGDKWAYSLINRKFRIERPRENLVYLAFALELTLEEIQHLIQNYIHDQPPSPTVPEELILIYCLENGYTYACYVEIQDKYMQRLIGCRSANSAEKLPVVRDVYTYDIESLNKTDWTKVSKEDFIEYLLKSHAYSDAASRPRHSSRTVHETYLKLIPPDENTRLEKYIFFPTFIQKYFYTLREHKISFSKKLDSIFSLNIDYGNEPPCLSRSKLGLFLYYRIKNERRTSAKCLHSSYCFLPYELCSASLHTDARMGAQLKDPSRINRSDLLMACYSAFLFSHQENIAANSELKAGELYKECKGLRGKWEIRANQILERCGYEHLTAANPLDCLLINSFFSLSPHEVFTRVYQIAVVETMVNQLNAGERVESEQIELLKDYNVENALADAYRCVRENTDDAEKCKILEEIENRFSDWERIFSQEKKFTDSNR